MRLRDLDAKFVGHYAAGNFSFLYGPDKCQGVMFQCPKCAESAEQMLDGGYRGVHSVLVWFSNPRDAPMVPDNAIPGPGRWHFTGDSIDTLSLGASVLIDCWHGFIKHGAAYEAK